MTCKLPSSPQIPARILAVAYMHKLELVQALLTKKSHMGKRHFLERKGRGWGGEKKAKLPPGLHQSAKMRRTVRELFFFVVNRARKDEVPA